MRTLSEIERLPSDAGLTLAELSLWSSTSPEDLYAFERAGVICRDRAGLFPILETTNRLADHWETAVACLEASQDGPGRPSTRGWLQ